MQLVNSASIKEYSFFSQDVGTTNTQAAYVSENTMMRHWHNMKGYVDLTDKVTEFMAYNNPMYTSAYGGMLDYLTNMSAVETIEASHYRWRMRRRNHSYIRCVENLYPNTPKVAIGAAKLQVKLDVGWVRPGTYIWPEKDSTFMLITDSPGIEDGSNGYIYTCTKAKNLSYFPAELLKPMERWCVGPGVYSEGSRGYSGFYMTNIGYTEFKGQMWHTAKSYEVTDEAVMLSDAGTLVMTATDIKTGQKDYEAYLPMVEAEFIAQDKYEQKKILWLGEDFGQTAIDSTTGLHRKTGVGLKPLLKYSNRLDYMPGNTTIKFWQNAFHTYWDMRVPHEQRSIIMNAGSLLIETLNEDITEAFKQSGYVANMTDFTNTNGPTYNGSMYKGLVFQTAYFTKWVGFPSGSFEAVWEPFFDDESIHGSLRHNGRLISSGEGVIWDGGMGQTFTNNVKYIKRKGGENYTHHYGTWSPWGAINNGGQGLKINSDMQLGRRYLVGRESRFGIRIKDISLPILVKTSITY